MSSSPTDWIGCGDYSTPDTQPTNDSWNFGKPASNGSAYMSLVMRGSVGAASDYFTEAAGTKLSQPFKANVCYTMQIDLATFLGATFNNGWETVNYNNPGSLAIWTSNASCGKSKLLWESPIIDKEEWTTFSFQFSLTEPINYVLLEARFANPTIKVFGNIMIDNIRVTSEPVGFSEDTIVMCAGSSTTLNAPQGIDQLSWWNGQTEPIVTVKTAGAFWASLRKGQCTILDTIHVSAVPDINFDLGPDSSLCLKDVLFLNVSSPYAQYEWNDGINTATRTISAPGTYRVTVRNQCEELSDQITVSYRDECCQVSMPNVFTPNGDEFNNQFEFSTESDVIDFNLAVFNRWGNPVFESNELSYFWDGTVEGKEASAGVYYWVCQIKCKHKSEILERTVKGHVSIFR